MGAPRVEMEDKGHWDFSSLFPYQVVQKFYRSDHT